MTKLVKKETLPEKTEALKYFCYDQNNSGGSFIFNDQVGEYVFIQAHSASEANDIAETVGIYFGGEGDCPCCGDRWSTAWGDGTDVPMIYGKSLDESVDGKGFLWAGPGQAYAHVYHYDGTKTSYIRPDNKKLK